MELRGKNNTNEFLFIFRVPNLLFKVLSPSAYLLLLSVCLLINTSVCTQDISTGLVPLTDEGFGTRRIDSYGRYVSANKDVVYDQQYAQRILRDVDDCNSSNVINQSILLLITSFILSCPIVFDWCPERAKCFNFTHLQLVLIIFLSANQCNVVTFTRYK